jgi:hypothetical protein
MKESSESVYRVLPGVEQLQHEVQAVLRQAAALLTQSYHIAEQSGRIQARADQITARVIRTRVLLRKQQQPGR